MLKYWLIGAVSASLLGLAATSGNAAPGAGPEAVKSAFRQSSAVEKAATACWWQNGMRVCSRGRAYGYNAPAAYGYYNAPAVYGYYGAPVYGYYSGPRASGYGVYYGRPRPEAFPTGSTSWWRAMDYEGRGGHGRGF